MKAQIIDAVNGRPGIHFRELQREVGCSVNTLDYHLRRIDGLNEERIRGYRRIFPAQVDTELYDALAALNHESRGLLLHVVDREPGLTMSGIGERVELSLSSVSEHLRALAADDVVLVQRDGRARRYEPSGSAVTAIRRFGGRLLDRYADGFVSMWE
ncbi:MAG: winged helix-turn-helix transcriptional regulator [Candidatus Nanohaloarchaea archaeon]|nr:winged helix-turn-helix transcriptional regulator [Candidatus Nanohaloarchaea archaeon]